MRKTYKSHLHRLLLFSAAVALRNANLRAVFLVNQILQSVKCLMQDELTHCILDLQQLSLFTPIV